jgi:hypothetical protein
MALPDAIEKVPTGGPGLNKPTSGTYGERAELDNLKASLPPMAPAAAPGAGGGAAPMPDPDFRPPGMEPGRPGRAPAGVPPVLLEGDGPAAPAAPVDAPGAVNPQQDRIALLDYLATAPDVSEQTREWAKTVLEMLIEGSRLG